MSLPRTFADPAPGTLRVSTLLTQRTYTLPTLKWSPMRRAAT